MSKKDFINGCGGHHQTEEVIERTMTHASLFSGIGGSEVAAVMLGWDNLFHCEINPFGRAVLDYWFPNSTSYEDITKTDFTEWRGRVDVLTGGFPCQPFSYAGKRGGANDDRYLWPQMLRVIQECRPSWVVGENVAGITTMVEQGEVVEVGMQTALFGEEDTLRSYELRERYTIERICSDLERLGYAVQPFVIPACAVGAPHRRDRVFIIGRDTADTDSMGRNGRRCETDRRQQGNVGQELLAQSERPSRCGSAPDTASVGGREIHEHMEPELAERNEPVGNGRKPNAPDTSDNGLEHNFVGGCQAEEHREPSGSGAELHLPTAADGSGRTTAYADRERREERVLGGEQAHRTQEGAGMDDRTQRPCDNEYAANAESEQCPGLGLEQSQISQSWEAQFRRRIGSEYELGQRWQGFPTVSPVHRGNDGFPFDVDDLTIPFAQWRTESLKAYGNAIVPQVMYEIFRAIEAASQVQSHTSDG